MFLEGMAIGRLLSYSPDTRQVTVHLSDLTWANSVAVASGGEFVLDAETFATRVQRLWLSGEKAGTNDLFIDGLPGAPDNLSVDDRGTNWIGIRGIRDREFEKAGRQALRVQADGCFAAENDNAQKKACLYPWA